jgi:hypothetical protein
MQHNGNHTADKYFYLQDRLGSVREIIDANGTVKNYYTYKPFGEILTAESDCLGVVRHSRAKHAIPILSGFSAFSLVNSKTPRDCRPGSCSR